MHKDGKGQITAFEFGAIYQALQSVSLGGKPVASGDIKATAKKNFLNFVRQSGFGQLHIGFGPPRDGRIEWRASRLSWCLDALDWVNAGGRTVLGDFHLHWVQGLLYGYSPEQIATYLAKRD